MLSALPCRCPVAPPGGVKYQMFLHCQPAMSRTRDHPIFEPQPILPRGPHRLSRDQVAASQRSRLMAAFTELLAERGYGGVTIGELARRARVSRATFYAHFVSKEACMLAAYDHFAATIVEAMSPEVDADRPWSEYIDATLRGYLGVLERDPGAARAFIVEMDAAGPAARRRRRDAIHAFAALLAQRHAEMRARDPSLGPLPELAYLVLALGVRELVRERLESEPVPALTTLAPEIVALVTSAVEGAAAAASREGGG
jgi:AcrR family transcriptional regulator